MKASAGREDSRFWSRITVVVEGGYRSGREVNPARVQFTTSVTQRHLGGQKFTSWQRDGNEKNTRHVSKATPTTVGLLAVIMSACFSWQIQLLPLLGLVSLLRVTRYYTGQSHCMQTSLGHTDGLYASDVTDQLMQMTV